MGIDSNGATFLCYAKTEGVSFEATAMLGRQNLHGTPAQFRRVFRRFGYDADIVRRAGEHAEEFFRALGGKQIDSFDASSYEGATHVHDFNQPIPDPWKNRYSAVLDGGTLEHVFDFPRAIRNAMEMVAVGGHYLGITPANNFCGHGFYQFSPELYFRVFAQANGFRMIRLLMFRDSPRSAWYEVADPQQVHRRVTLLTSLPSYLAVLALRTEVRQIFATPPMQSDYQDQWAAQNEERGWKTHPLAQALYRTVPGVLKHIRRRDGQLFRKVDLTRLALR